MCLTLFLDSVESQWQELQRMYDELRHETDPSGIVKQVLYCSMALFMSCLINYSGRMDPQQFAGVFKLSITICPCYSFRC